MEINKPISAIILLVITLVLVFLFAVPKYNESKALQVKLVEKQAQYNGASAYHEKISTLLAGIEIRKEALGKVDSALPLNASLATLVYFFQKKAAETGLMPKSINFAQISPITARETIKSQENSADTTLTTRTVRDVNFTLELLGNYQGLKDFIVTLEKSARLFEVNSIAFASLRSSGLIKGQGQIQTYSFRLAVKTHSY